MNLEDTSFTKDTRSKALINRGRAEHDKKRGDQQRLIKMERDIAEMKTMLKQLMRRNND
jgi:hypothetical protein